MATLYVLIIIVGSLVIGIAIGLRLRNKNKTKILPKE